MAGLVSREALAEFARRRRTVDVAIEDGDDTHLVRLRALSAGDALDFRAEVAACERDGGDPEQLAPRLIARSWIDEAGDLLLPEDQGVALARALSPEVYAALAAAVLSLNGLAEASIEDAAKN